MNYKRILTYAFLMLGTTVTFAQTKTPVQVKGSVLSTRNEVKLYKVANGEIAEIAKTTVNNSKQFGFLFYPDYEGLYVIGTGAGAGPAEHYKFYFKPGDQLDIILSDTNYTLGKSSSKENLVLKQWADLTNPLYQKAINFMRSRSTFIDYFPQQEEIVAKSKTFLTNKATGNAKFDKDIKDIMEMDLANYASNYINTPRTAHPDVAEFSDFYNTLKVHDLSKNTQKIYNYPWGNRVVGSLIMINIRQDNKKYGSGLEGLQTSVDYIANDTLKGDKVLDLISRYKTVEEYNAAIDKFGKYILTEAQKQRSNTIMSPLLTYKTGTDGFQFSYKNTEGKEVSLASLKGKVVVVDVWATWCGPCRAEFPHIKQLAKDVEGKPIQLVSISVDADKDKDKWLKMIKDEQLVGTHLFAGQANEFSKYYKINGIPRFLVFDKNGKIVNVDAPRPSDPKLKALLFAEALK